MRARPAFKAPVAYVGPCPRRPPAGRHSHEPHLSPTHDRFAPAFKILTYFGSQKERKLKRQGWSKTNAFHVCITSYKLVIQDAAAFRRKKWKYLVLDEAHHIKNFRSQRWQTLLNFNAKRRLLLTGTPLQNNLMELWSLLHFLMPHIFESHKEFKDWFCNPVTGMIEGTETVNQEPTRTEGAVPALSHASPPRSSLYR